MAIALALLRFPWQIVCAGVSPGSVNPQDYGTVADGLSHTITQSDIDGHKEWLGCGTAVSSGRNLTWVTGAKFLTALDGSEINFNGADYQVVTVGPPTAGVATTLTLKASAGSAGPKRWCMYSVGDQRDYIGLQEAIFASNAAPGSELSNGQGWKSRQLDVPCGKYQINKPLIINRGIGLNLLATQRMCVEVDQLSPSVGAVITNGLAYSNVQGFEFNCKGSSTTTACFDLDYDGKGEAGIALQANTFSNNVIGTSTYTFGIGLRIGNTGYMGSENLFLNNHFSGFRSRCVDIHDFNSLGNSIVGGNVIDCAGDGIYVYRGTVDILNTDFENGTPISHTPQTGCDIKVMNSANDTINITGGRTESGCFVESGNGMGVTIRGVLQTPVVYAWAANKECSTFKGNLVIPPTTSKQYIGGAFITNSTSGRTGESEPRWAYLTTLDGSCKWIYTPLTFADSDGPTTVENVQSIGGSIRVPPNATYALAVRNSVFSHADWLNPNDVSPFAYPPYPIILENNAVYPGGGANNGGPAASYSIAGPAARLIQDYSNQSERSAPIIFSSGARGVMDADSGIGPGRNPLSSTAMYPEDILAVLSPEVVNTKLGRRDAFGLNHPGRDQDIAAGRSTGAGEGGSINFWTNGSGSNGSTVNTLLKQARIDPVGNFTFTSGKGQHINAAAANNDFGGKCIAKASTECIVKFTHAYSFAPVCTASDENNPRPLKVTPSPASLVIVTAARSSDTFDYVCVGNPN
jgi:hypothetical protein